MNVLHPFTFRDNRASSVIERKNFSICTAPTQVEVIGTLLLVLFQSINYFLLVVLIDLIDKERSFLP